MGLDIEGIKLFWSSFCAAIF